MDLPDDLARAAELLQEVGPFGVNEQVEKVVRGRQLLYWQRLAPITAQIAQCLEGGNDPVDLLGSLKREEEATLAKFQREDDAALLWAKRTLLSHPAP